MVGPEPIDSRPAIIAAFHKQAGWCGSSGSPFTAYLLTLLADDIESGGPAADQVDSWTGDPVADALPLRMTGALHALVLEGEATELAACYPPHAPLDAERLRSCVLAVLAERRDAIRSFMSSPPQTNEVGRSGVLLGGFLRIAEQTRLPLRLLEIGASAGLNTVWDLYCYRFGAAHKAAHWGDPRSAVMIAPEWHGPHPRLDASLRVAERHACDVAPIDLEDAAQRLRLRAYIWPDQGERLSRLDAAMAVARRAGVAVEQADAADWAGRRMREAAAGSVTVLYHTIMWQYMTKQGQQVMIAQIRVAAARATTRMPFAWLRFEPQAADRRPELRLTVWPGGQELHLASAHPHGSSISWLGA